jgi:hypothetical protein
MSDKIAARPGSLEPLSDAAITYRYIAPLGVTLDEVMVPTYWRNNIRDLSRTREPGKSAFNRIEILAADGTWEADVRVMDAADGIATLRLLRVWPENGANAAKEPEVSAPDGYRVEFIENNGWRALEPGGNMLIEKRTTRDEALKRAQEHSRKAKGSK